jgi:hypothetical protein
MRALIILCLSLVACAPTTKAGWYADAARSEAACHWQNKRWYDRGVLLAHFTGLPMARAWGITGEKDAWHGSLMSGRLRQAGPHFLLEGTWRAKGIVIDADVDLNDEPVLEASVTVVAGPAVVLPRSAGLRVVEARTGLLKVRPTDAALAVFTPVASPVVEMACEAVTIYPKPDDLLAAAGFDAAAPVVVLSQLGELPFLSEPGGEVVGTLHAKEQPSLARLEVRGDQSHVALLHESGAVFHGWVPSSALSEPAKGEGFSNVYGVGGLLGNRAEQKGWRACATERRLYARFGERVAHVGRLEVGTPFLIGSARGGTVPITFRDDWLSPVEGVQFELEVDAALCGPWTP